jgi:hypothetical protein
LKCALCDRKTDEEGYCELHAKAYKNIVGRYDVWKKALEISWKEYLSAIARNSLTGEWAKDVAEYLIRSGEKQSVTQG